MAVIQIPGRVSGKNYSFNIAGDIPTPTEQGRIAQALQIEEEKFRRYYESNVGEPLAEPDDGTAIGRGIDRGLASAKNRLGTAQRFLGERTGLDFLKDYGAGVEDQGQYEQFLAQMAQPAPTERQDVKGLMSGLTYAGEQLGQTIPETGAVIAATGAGTLLGSPALGLTAGALTAAPTIFGGNIQRQEEEVKAGRKPNVDITAALIATVGQAAIESIADKFLVLGFLKPGQKLFSRTVGGLAEGAALEAPTEVAQQIIERAQAGLPLDDDAAMQEYIDSAIAGGIVGSSIRGPTAMLGIGAGAPATTAPTQTEEELAAQDEARLARIAAAEETVLAAAPEPISPEGTDQGELFPTAEQAQRAPRLAEPTVQELMDTLQIPKAAPIRRRLRDFTPNAPEVLAALEKHQRQPGIKAETKAAIKDFLATQTVAAPAVATAQTVKAPTDAAAQKLGEPFTYTTIDGKKTLVAPTFESLKQALGLNPKQYYSVNELKAAALAKGFDAPSAYLSGVEVYKRLSAKRSSATVEDVNVVKPTVTTGSESGTPATELGVGDGIGLDAAQGAAKLETPAAPGLGATVSDTSTDNVPEGSQSAALEEAKIAAEAELRALVEEMRAADRRAKETKIAAAAAQAAAKLEGSKPATLGLFENMGQDGALMEYPEVAANLDKYVQNIDFAALDAATKSEEYAQYQKTMASNLAEVFPSGEIPVTRTEGYADPKAEKTKRNFTVRSEDVAFVGNVDEQELVIRTPEGKLQSVRIGTAAPVEEVAADLKVAAEKEAAVKLQPAPAPAPVLLLFPLLHLKLFNRQRRNVRLLTLK
jgi:hypothetical protein